MKIGYVNVFVSNLGASIEFFRDVLGLTLIMGDESFGYASFDAGMLSLGLAVTDDAHLLGRHTGVGFVVDDIDAKYTELAGLGVDFEMPPTKQPWGGTLALFKDPDNNIYYLDPGHHEGG